MYVINKKNMNQYQINYSNNMILRQVSDIFFNIQLAVFYFILFFVLLFLRFSRYQFQKIWKMKKNQMNM